ncbi:MAG TPA: translation initiation factor IF-2 [Clostridia bacterium]|nr:translation initiation factor IF-2 [Clostridia bacterium]
MSKLNVYGTAKKVTESTRDLIENISNLDKSINGYKKTIQNLRKKLENETNQSQQQDNRKAQKLEEEILKKQEELKQVEIVKSKQDEVKKTDKNKTKQKKPKEIEADEITNNKIDKPKKQKVETKSIDKKPFKKPQSTIKEGVASKGAKSTPVAKGTKAETTKPTSLKGHEDKQNSKGPKKKKDYWEERALNSKNRRKRNKRGGFAGRKQGKPTVVAERKKAISMGEFISVKSLSEKIGVSVSAILKKLMGMGVLATINHDLDYEMATVISSEFGIELEQKNIKSFEEILTDEDVEDDPTLLTSRPPIITVMGHVDHGKTSLLDAIRNAKVTSQEAGGITQHIGAYTVNLDNKPITFLDTPGHEAFTSMRARGAQITDIAILVVAANDGVMPQTIEAINHAKEAEVPIIVAINKIDVPGANPDRVKQELTEHGLLVEEWGGDTIAVSVSALKNEGIDNLLEMILLVSEMQELKSNPDRLARGTIIEAQLDKGRGPVATILVQKGTLKTGDFIVAGTAYGRVRAMMDHTGRRIKVAGPSTPVQVLGLTDVPEAGDVMYAVEDDKLARQVAEERKIKNREQQIHASSKMSLDDLFSKIEEGEVKDLNLIIKADVQGSVEAIKQSLERLSNKEVRVKNIHGGVGAITESDVMLATASNAIIIGFNVRPSVGATSLASKEKIDIRLYRVIYNAIEDIEDAMKGMLDPIYKEVILGNAQVREIFKVPGAGIAAGCYVTDGKITRNADIRLVRNGIVVYEGKISSLKRFKDDVREVATGYECGISLENYNDIKEEDIIEASIQEEIKQ